MITSMTVEGKRSESAPFSYVWGKAYHILPETHNNESGYFSLCEGLDGSIYVGTAKYGVNSYLVEFDPGTETQKIVIDTHKVCGLTDTGYAAQAKIHTRNFVGDSGKIYVGSMQGYPTEQDKRDDVKYPGGYLMTYDPRTGEAECLGMPYKGEGIIDVAADEARGLIYVVTVQQGLWMLYDVKSKEYRELGPKLANLATTLFDASGRAVAITRDSQLAQYDPDSGKLVTRDILVDRKKINLDESATWILSDDARSAYLIRLTNPTLIEIDLMGTSFDVKATAHGRMVKGKNPDSRCALTLSPDGQVYALVRVKNKTSFGSGNLHHLARFDPMTKKIDHLGVLAVENPDFFFSSPGARRGHPATSEDSPPYYGYHKLPDGTLTPLLNHLGLIAADDGTLYVTIIYPFTLLRLDAFKLGRFSDHHRRGQTTLKSTLPKDENREVRTWTSKAGVTMRAAVVEEKGEYVVLKKEDGSRAMIRKTRLSKADVVYIESLKTTATSE